MSVSRIRLAMNAERLLMAGSVMAILTIISIVWFLLGREYESTREVALRGAKTIAQLIEGDVQRNVALYDVSLQGVVDVSQNLELASVPASLKRQLLFGRAISASVRGDVLWIDERGQTVADSFSEPPRSFDFSHRENFKLHKASSSAALHISRPFQDQLGGLAWCIAFTRRLTGPDGSFRGVASGVLRLDYFNDLFKSIDIGRNSSVSLLNLEGDMLAREPQGPEGPVTGRSFAQWPHMLRMLRGGASGAFVAISNLDGIKRLYSYTRVTGVPMIIVIAMAYDDVFDPWVRIATLVWLATAGLCTGIFCLAVLFGRELRRGRSSEINLAALAATDPLTGLANRRRLDELMALEWARAERSNRSLALLMIDVDHFGRYNELNGHHGGDDALRTLAQIVRDSAQRPGDLAARYGGEEFVVVLVETSLEGAMLLAEALRQEIHSHPPQGRVDKALTVSIGVAAKPEGGAGPATVQALLCEADAALYQAKREGRNRVRHAGNMAPQKKTPAAPA